MSAKHLNKDKQLLFILSLLLSTLVLSYLNIKNFYDTKDVLGATTSKVESYDKFWNEYLKNNPNYIPGWLEIGRDDKVLEIDPNYKLVTDE